jgi:hypothetical protein
MSVHSRQDMPLFDLAGGAAGGERPDALVVHIKTPAHRPGLLNRIYARPPLDRSGQATVPRISFTQMLGCRSR